MKFERLSKNKPISKKALIEYTKKLNEKKDPNIKKKREYFSEKDKKAIISGFKSKTFNKKQRILILQQLIQEEVYVFNDVMDINNQFEFIITDLETRLNSEEFIEEIQVRNKKSLLLEFKDPEKEKLDIFYEKVFSVLVTIGIIFFIIAKILNFYYKMHALIFPFDPVPVFFNYWIISDFTFSSVDKAILTMYDPTSHIVEKLIDYCIQHNIFF